MGRSSEAHLAGCLFLFRCFYSFSNSPRFLCEQVSHHPPVSAYHAHGGENLPGAAGKTGSPWEVQVRWWRWWYSPCQEQVPSKLPVYTSKKGEFELKTKFWGKSIELLMIGCESLKLHSFQEEFR